MRNSAESAGVQATPVAIPPGETSLADIGIFSVHWQSYGKAAAAMPLGWTGHFDPATGISYQDWGQVLGRRALLMHSPWHVAPGRTWVEYPLALPNVTPIRLSFGIAMNPDSVGPGKSDGVTFACSLIAGGKKQSLMREHYVKAEWLDYHFDLSPYAGKTIVLGLQVEPGPKNDASFDLSLFGDAKITAGEGVEPKSEAIRRLVSSRANRVAAKANLVPLCNDATRGIVPSNICRGKNATQRMGTAWQFLYQGDDCRIAYTYRPATGTLDDFTVQVDDGQPFQPASGGGATVTVKQDGKLIGVPARGGRVLRVDEDHGCLRVEWEYQVGGQPLCITWSYRIQDKSLVVGAECQERSISRFSFGGLGPVPLRKVIRVPYLSGQLSYLPAERVFVCRYLDWTCSNASLCPQGEAVYEPKTDGSRNPLAERGFIAVSSNLGEVLPNIPHPPSPYLAVLGPRIMLDIWNHHAGTFRGDAENLLDLKDNGVDHVAIIQHVWQRYGYDVKLPDHLPADPHFGGDEGMIVFGKAANACGYLWSVHENYIDLYPDAPSVRPEGARAAGRRLALQGMVQWRDRSAELWTEVQSGPRLRQTELAGNPSPFRHHRRLLGCPYLRAAVAPTRPRGRPADVGNGPGQGKVRPRVVPIHARHARRSAFRRGVQSILLGRPLRWRGGPGRRRRGPCPVAGLRPAETPSADGQPWHGLLRALVPCRIRSPLGLRQRHDGTDRQVSRPGIDLRPRGFRRRRPGRQCPVGRSRTPFGTPGATALRHRQSDRNRLPNRRPVGGRGHRAGPWRYFAAADSL